MAYSTIARLGAEASENGENRKERAKEDCISKEARRQIASLGMIRLDTTPTVTRRGVSVAAPICSIQPPMKRSEEHTSELQSQSNLVCRLLLEKKKKKLQQCVNVNPI